MDKDWTGNKATFGALLGSSCFAKDEREQNDFYATDPESVKALLNVHNITDKIIWEPACGLGHISKTLENAGHQVISQDMIDRGYGQGNIDFLKSQKAPDGCNCIITNPPYKYTLEFIEHSMKLLKDGGEAIFLLNINNLAGQKRYEHIYKHNYLSKVYVFIKRQSCAKNGEFSKFAGSSINYGWFVFKKGNSDIPTIQWI
jgi:hypothetical protein